MKINRGSVMVVLVLALTAPARGSAAAPASPELVARATGEEGLQRFHAGKWQAAYALFERANNTFHAVTLVLYMAHCRARQGDLAAAWRLYREVLREPLAGNAPVQFQTAQAVARQELHWILPHIALVKITVTGVPAAEARVLVDGVEVPTAELDEIGVEPGPRVVAASVAGGATVQRTITATAGRTDEVTLWLTPPDTHDPTKVAVSAAPALSFLPAGITLGLGGAALVTGSIAGGISLHEADTVKSRCVGGHCPASEEACAGEAGRLADVSTGMFIAGGIAAATGVLLAVLHVRSRRALQDSAMGALHVDIGPGSAGIGGGF